MADSLPDVTLIGDQIKKHYFLEYNYIFYFGLEIVGDFCNINNKVQLFFDIIVKRIRLCVI